MLFVAYFYIARGGSWTDDPQLAQTLAHEATHALLYERGIPFGHCAEDNVTGCQQVDQMTSQAEREAKSRR